jgi:hypothetical protein
MSSLSFALTPRPVMHIVSVRKLPEHIKAQPCVSPNAIRCFKIMFLLVDISDDVISLNTRLATENEDAPRPHVID